jgi:hypothetical protein
MKESNNCDQTLSLSEKIASKRAEGLATVPIFSQMHFTPCWAGKTSPLLTIKAQRPECNVFGRRDISECVTYACQLWIYDRKSPISVPFGTDLMGAKTVSQGKQKEA